MLRRVEHIFPGGLVSSYRQSANFKPKIDVLIKIYIIAHSFFDLNNFNELFISLTF